VRPPQLPVPESTIPALLRAIEGLGIAAIEGWETPQR